MGRTSTVFHNREIRKHCTSAVYQFLRKSQINLYNYIGNKSSRMPCKNRIQGIRKRCTGEFSEMEEL